VFGALAWVLSFVWLGFFFGNLPIIKDNFGLVTIGIIVVSMLPVIFMALKKPPAVPSAGS
jgi:membrane-associated protein